MNSFRTAILLATILLYQTAYSQFNKVKGTWISSANDVLILVDATNEIDHLNTLSTLTESDEMILRIIGDTLSFRSEYLSGEDHFKKIRTDKYDMLISDSAKSRLVLSPVSDKAKDFFNNRNKIEFLRAEYNIDKTIHLEKLIYHTTTCFGSCPVVDMEVDENKVIYLQGKFFGHNSRSRIDSLRSGTFMGVLPDSLYNELIFILQTSNLRTLTFPEVRGADAPESTLIIYYNGQRKYLKSMFPPTIARRLIHFLYSLSKNIVLERTAEKKQLEK